MREKHTLENLEDSLDAIEERFGYRFTDRALLRTAFTHRSILNEQDFTWGHNERLEYLGDSVLELVISDHLYRRFPKWTEGRLSEEKSRLVDAVACGSYLKKLEVEECLVLGRGEIANLGKGRKTLIADLFEAIMGAVFLDGGLDAAARFFFAHFKKEVQAILDEPNVNWKAQLQDLIQKSEHIQPEYRDIVEESDPADQQFVVEVWAQERYLARGVGTSKKEARVAAAKAAVEGMQESGELDG